MKASTPPPIERKHNWQNLLREFIQSKRELEWANEDRDTLGEGMYEMRGNKAVYIDPLNPEGRKANNIKREHFNTIPGLMGYQLPTEGLMFQIKPSIKP